MTRDHAVFTISDPERTKKRLLAWADSFPVSVYLDSNAFPHPKHSSWECLVGAGAHEQVNAGAGQAFPLLKDFFNKKQDWLFGFFGYDLKNEVEKLHSQNADGIGLPDLYFFQPEIVAGIRRGAGANSAAFSLEIFSLDIPVPAVYEAIQTANPAIETSGHTPKTTLTPRISKPRYLKTVEAIRRHIEEGDVYEMNLCQEFYAEKAVINPRRTFEQLNTLTRAPFAAYMRYGDWFLLCASPERFMRKQGHALISQPIKGTRRRHAAAVDDARIREELRDSIKDRAENVMIVDLVRNDLARHCLPGSVQVEELFGIYTFQTVHQMISTITGVLRPDTHPLDALRDAFPMGSMTGAPKVMAMELIEYYEHTRRGLFSGAVGYFTPDGDFDFNVVIRSILYHAGSGYLSCQVGVAIVHDSVPEQEYEECLVKIKALMQALGS